MQVSNKSHLKLEEKTALVRKEFNLPESLERVVQDYRCTLAGKGSGKIYITQYHVFFYRNSDALASVAYRVVNNVKCVNKTLVVQTSEHEEYVFSSFTTQGKRDEAFALVHHFVEFPFHLQVPRPVVVASPPSSPRFSSAPSSSSQLSRLVDVESGKRAVESGQRARDTGAATLSELHRQDEQIKKMDEGIDKMERSMDQAERHLRGVESVGGAIMNKMHNNNNNNNSNGGMVPQRHSKLVRHGSMMTQQQANVHKVLQVGVVWKHPNDSLQEATAYFEENNLRVKTEDGAVDSVVPYDAMDSVVLRARPFHCDIIIKGQQGDRVRMCSARMQTLVNALAFRCSTQTKTLPVVFERNAISFQYNCDLIDDVGMSSSSTPSSDTGMYAHLPQDVREGIKIQDKQLDDVERVAKDLQMMGRQIGTEVDQSTQDLKALGKRMDDVGMRISVANERVVRLL